MLLQTMHDIIGNSVALFFRQLLAKTPHKFARAPEREGDGKTQHVAAGTHPVTRTNREQLSIRLPLQRPPRGKIGSYECLRCPV